MSGKWNVSCLDGYQLIFPTALQIITKMDQKISKLKS